MKKNEKGHLCYLFCGDGNAIDGREFNFDSNMYFKRINIQSEQISIKKFIYKNRIPDNFFSDNISELTAIIGKNGVGKSSTIRIILENLLSETAMNGEYYTAIFKLGESYILTSTMNQEIVLYDIDESIIDYESKNVMKFYNSILYVSNVFDGYKINIRELKMKDFKTDPIISTMNYIMTDAFMNDGKINKYYNNKNISNPVYTLIYDEMLQYLSENKFREIFKSEIAALPNGLVFDIGEIDFSNCNRESKNYKLYEDFLNVCRKGYLLPDKNFNKRFSKDGFFINQKRACFESTCNKFTIQFCYYFMSKYNNVTNEIIECIYERMTEGNENGIIILSEIMEQKSSYFDDKDLLLIRFISKILDNKVEDYYLDRLIFRYNDYKTDNKSKTDISKIRRRFNNPEKTELPIGCDFTYIIDERKKKIRGSSGEILKMRLLFEIYKFAKNVKKDKDNKNVLILIDEWDLYLHPELQRKGISEIISAIELLFQDYNVQLIFTSNSPFALSDIPNNCINALNEESNDAFSELTFGANIHTLLRNQFFMNITVGEFSRKKINGIIQLLQNPQAIDDEKQHEIFQIINIIGEPIVKKKLIKMYYSVFPNESNNAISLYNEQIAELRKYISSMETIDKRTITDLRKQLNESIDLLDKLDINMGKEL